MSSLRVYYDAAGYRSHARVASVYREIIGQQYSLAASAEAADVVLLHHEPHRLGDLLAARPRLRDKYLIAYCVWEASRLPESYRRPIAHVQEVWTCSRYCLGVYGQHHPRVSLIPHVVERGQAASPEIRRSVARAIRYHPGQLYFLAIGRVWDKRKNLATLVRVFVSIAGLMPRARFIVKCSLRERALLPDHPQITVLCGDWPDSYIDALYNLSDAYVSAHHGEGWGLTISDAMLMGKPVIATAYSGNMDFMNSENSVLLDYAEEEIHPEDHYCHFGRGMSWAYVRPESLAAALLNFYADPCGRRVATRIRAGLRSVERYTRQAVSSLIFGRLDAIHRSLN